MNELPSPILFFDGVCNLCNASVDFIIRRDRNRRIRFASLQSDFAAEALRGTGINPEELRSMVLLNQGRAYKDSGAVLRVTRFMGGLWPLAQAFLAVPAFIRDPVYRLVARNRYRWFGRTETCRLPSPQERERFLG